MNNAEERISDVEDRIMEITQSGQQTENQMKKKKTWKQYKRSMGEYKMGQSAHNRNSRRSGKR